MSVLQLLIRNAAVSGRHVDIVVLDGRVHELPVAGAAPVAQREIDAEGAAVIAGLHDHHIHLLAAAAAALSVDVSPLVVHDLGSLASALGSRPGTGWVRAVGYHESGAGEIDRDVLDRVCPERPVRVQHRSGACWFLNSLALRRCGVADQTDGLAGVECDAEGRPTGRIFRADPALGERWGDDSVDALAGLAAVGERLARCGVTGCTDATPMTDAASVQRFARALRQIPQRVHAMSAPGVDLEVGQFTVGPVKVVLGDHDLPRLDEIEQWFQGAHGVGRPVAVHVVTDAALALAVTAWRAVGVRHGDRIEHGAVIPADAIDELVELGLRVVTQPCFVAERGDTYLDEVPDTEHRDLWRCGSLLAAGVPVGGGSDAPYGSLDPWAGIRAAVHRRTASGRELGREERLAARAALALWLGRAEEPGGEPRMVAPGTVADLCVLDAPLDDVLRAPSAARVRATVAAGEMIWEA